MEKETLEALVKHARKFGPEGVVEAAIELGAGEESLTKLITAIDAIEGSARGKRFTTSKRRRLTPRQRARRLLGLDKEEAET